MVPGLRGDAVCHIFGEDIMKTTRIYDSLRGTFRLVRLISTSPCWRPPSLALDGGKRWAPESTPLVLLAAQVVSERHHE